MAPLPPLYPSLLHRELLRGLPDDVRRELHIDVAGRGGIQYRAVAAGRATQHTERSIDAVGGVKRRTERQRQIADVVLRGRLSLALVSELTPPNASRGTIAVQ